MRRRDVQERDALLADEAQQIVDVLGLFLGQHMQRGPDEERRPVAGHGHVEGVGGHEGQPFRRRDA